MEKVAVVGCGGSGKSHFAVRAARILGLPVIHLDSLYYDEQWRTTPKEDFARAQENLVSRSRWIIDGNYASTLPIRLQGADAVIVMDLSALACLRNIVWRRFRYRGGQHAHVGVYDRITWSFIRYVLSYRRIMLPRVQALVAEHADQATVIVLRSRRAVRAYLAALGSST